MTGDRVPSPEFGTGESALRHLLAGKQSIAAAVAFVSRPGVRILAALAERHRIEDIEIVARGGPPTDPDALLDLRQQLGADVRLVTGAETTRFHPKLWLLRGPNELHVLSGSGNLTEGGLRRNREQFEVLKVVDKGGLEAQEKRFAQLTAGAIPLQAMQGSIAWSEWQAIKRDGERLAREVKRLERRVTDSPTLDVRRAEEALEQDLWRIHDRTVEAKLPDPSSETGRPYNPSGFRLELEGHRGATGPAHVVRRLCRRGTKGFGVILTSKRWDLTVESLIVKPGTPYYELFGGEIRERSEERLRQFPNWPGPTAP